MAIGLGAGMSPSGCSRSGPMVDDKGELHCGECNQYAYNCGGRRAICAPDDYSAGEIHDCHWVDKISCVGTPGTGGHGDDGDAGGETGSEVSESADTTAGDALCDDWAPGHHVQYDAKDRIYEVDAAFALGLDKNPLPIHECDQARAQLVSGGYYELYGVAPDDLAAQLGLLDGDIIKSINGFDLRRPEDYAKAFTALRSQRTFNATLWRRGKTITLKYVVR